MSQSDYIRFKRLSAQLADLSSFQNVLDAKQYTEFLGFSLVQQTPNTKQINSQLTLPNQTVWFSMPLQDVSTCSEYAICSGTQQRENRVLQTRGFYVTPSRPLTDKQRSQQTRCC